MNHPRYLKHFTIAILSLIISAPYSSAWGFFAHEHINKNAVFTLPKAMFGFYKHHIHFIIKNSINPDKKARVVEGEACKHFIDVDHYGKDAFQILPKYWKQATKIYSADTLRAHGILPWHIYRTKQMLTKAFQQKNALRILKISADLGHYIADAHVPLHTTENYDGQLTGQEGIHALWESRLPELFIKDYDLLTRKAAYIEDPQEKIWETIKSSHKAVEDVLRIERQVTAKFPNIHKYSFEQRGARLQKVYSKEYAAAYNEALQGQIEQQLKDSIKMVGDFWLTCWVDAGQPDLGELLLTQPINNNETKEENPQNKHLKGKHLQRAIDTETLP